MSLLITKTFQENFVSGFPKSAGLKSALHLMLILKLRSFNTDYMIIVKNVFPNRKLLKSNSNK